MFKILLFVNNWIHNAHFLLNCYFKMSHIHLPHSIFREKCLWIIPYLCCLFLASFYNYPEARSISRVSRPENYRKKHFWGENSTQFLLSSMMFQESAACWRFPVLVYVLCSKHLSIAGKRCGIIRNESLNICFQLALLFTFEH